MKQSWFYLNYDCQGIAKISSKNKHAFPPQRLKKLLIDEGKKSLSTKFCENLLFSNRKKVMSRYIHGK